jgi:hypothetical protein
MPARSRILSRGAGMSDVPVASRVFKNNQMNRARWSALLDGITYAALTLMVWGVGAFRRGLWQDDVQALGEAFGRSLHPLGALFLPDPSPLRRLTLIPSAIAWATPWPVEMLHVLCAAVWLGQALLLGWIVSLMLPGRPWTRFAVVCLTLTATSDFGTGSIVGLAYNVAALYLLASAGLAFLWLERGRLMTLAASLILLACSLLTMEVALPAVPFLALLFFWRGRRHAASRLAVLLAGWGAVVIPLAAVERSFLRDPKSYAAIALVRMPPRALVLRTISLWLENFVPWRWAFARPVWYTHPPAVIPTACMAAAGLFAAALYLFRVRAKRDEVMTADEGNLRFVAAAVFVIMALAANAAYAGVWFSELHYRTHILSRIWASAAIGILAGWIFARWPRLRWTAAAGVTLFVFFGAWGGVERQDYFLGSWRGHQRELVSILDAAPALRPSTAVILRGTPPAGRYLATEADYLTAHWLRLLYDDAQLRTFRLDPRRGASCAASPLGVVCQPEGRDISYDHKKRESLFRFNALVVMDYDAASGTWRLLRSFHGDPLARGHEAEAESYRPAARIVPGPWTLIQRRLLLSTALRNGGIRPVVSSQLSEGGPRSR